MASSRHIRRIYGVFFFYYIVQLANGFYKGHMPDGLFFWGMDLLEHIVLPALLLLYISKHVTPIMRTDRAETFSGRELVIYSIYSTPVLVLVYILTIALCAKLNLWGEPRFTYPSFIGEKYVLLTAVYFALSAAIFEEVFYRSLLYTAIRGSIKKNTDVLFIFVSALLFASVHWEGNIQNILGAFSFGIVSATLYTWFRHLLPLIIGHFILDFLLFYWQ